MRADVNSLSGTVTSNHNVDGALTSLTANISISGANFSLSGILSCVAVDGFSGDPNSVGFIFDPKGSVYGGFPDYGGCFRSGYTTGQLVYNGKTYTHFTVAMNFTGAPVYGTQQVPATVAPFISQASASNAPFTMTGTVYVNGQDPGVAPFLFNISGSGTFKGNVLVGNPTDPNPLRTATTFQFNPSPTLFTVDTTTQGNPSGKYGAEGALFPTQVSWLVPTNITVTNGPAYTWVPQTTDPRALPNGTGSARQASAYTGDGMSVDVFLTDGYVHRVSLYLVDWDTTTRTQVLTVTDGNTGEVLDQQTISNFHNGVWVSFNLKNHAVITFTRKVGAAPVVSGIFLGAAINQP